MHCTPYVFSFSIFALSCTQSSLVPSSVTCGSPQSMQNSYEKYALSVAIMTMQLTVRSVMVVVVKEGTIQLRSSLSTTFLEMR